MRLFGCILSGILAKDCWDENNLDGYTGNVAKSGIRGYGKTLPRITDQDRKNGFTCLQWSELDDPLYGKMNHNLCRNPDNDPQGPWCYHESSSAWSYCDVQKCDEACSCTKSGRTCQQWNTNTPHKVRKNKLVALTDSNNNFCANPDNDPRGNWCYTTDPKLRYDLCSETCDCKKATLVKTTTTTRTSTSTSFSTTTTSPSIKINWNSNNEISVGSVKHEPKWSKLALKTPSLLKSTGAKTVRYGLSDRIFGGAEAKTALPYQLGIQFKDADGATYFNCGGTLVSLRIGVTANHCIVPAATWYSTVGHFNKWGFQGTGVKRIPEPGFQKRTVQKVIEHPLYKITEDGKRTRNGKNNDITLFVFESAFEYTDYVRPAALPVDASFKVPPGAKCIISGWGQTKTGRSMELKLNVVPLTSFEKCKLNYGYMLTKHMICGGSEGQDTCQGDSGGPLVCMVEGEDEELVYTLVGVTSFGKGCGVKGIPGVYTEVADYLDWIHDAMRTYQ